MRPSTDPNTRSTTPRHGYQHNNQSNNQPNIPQNVQSNQSINQNNQSNNQSNQSNQSRTPSESRNPVPLTGQRNSIGQSNVSPSNTQYDNRYSSPTHARYNQSTNQSNNQSINQSNNQNYGHVQTHQPYNQPVTRSSPTMPAPSPPARPVPTPRANRSVDQSINQSINRFEQVSPTSPMPDSPDSDQPYNHSYNQSKSYPRHPKHSQYQSINQSNHQPDYQSTDQSDDYSPKRKPISIYTLTIVSVITLALIGVLGLILQSLFDPSNQSVNQSVYHPMLIPLRPIYPAQHLTNSLQITDLTPPRVDLDALLSSLKTAHKKLPFCPPDILSSGDVSLVNEQMRINAHQLIDQSVDKLISDAGSLDRLTDDSLDRLIDDLIDGYFDPDDVWPPIEQPVAVDQHYRLSTVFYQPDVTPLEMRKVAVPGNDVTIVRLIDLTNGASLNQSTNQPIDQPVVAGGPRVQAGVKLDKTAFMASDAIEWSEEEKTEMRVKFAQVSFNQNLGTKVIWQPEPHTLTISKEYPPPKKTDTQYLFGDEYLFIMLTEKKNHGLVRKSLSSWGQYVKHWQIYSDFYDSKLNTTVLTTPLSNSIPRELNKQPWRIPAFVSHLAKSTHLHRQFYVVIDEFSFPLLDQLKWRFDAWLGLWSRTFPSLIAGRPNKKPAKLSYWPEHQDSVSKLFSEPLQVLPKYAYGFDHTTLMQLHYYTPIDVCPVLTDDMLTFSGLLACAGGVTVEKHFLALTRSSHREKGIVGEQIAQWRTLDMYSGERTAGMVEEAFNWYYGGLAKLGPVETNQGNRTKSAFEVDVKRV